MPTLQASGKRIAAVHRQRLAIEVLIDGEEQDGLRHVLVLAWPLRRHLFVLALFDVALLVGPAAVGCHLAGEDARRDRVDADLHALARDLRRQHPVQVDRSAFGRVVGEVVLRRLHHAADGADVDDGPAPARVPLGALLQEREEGGRHEVF